jgi:hypothetical protein
MLCPRPTDAEIDADPAAWAAELLAHALAHRLPWRLRLLLAGVSIGAPWLLVEDARRVIREAAVALDAAAIALCLEVLP